MPKPQRHIAFLTGTRAEFGLMESTLRAIQAHPSLRLSLLVTGMHLDPRHGRSINHIRRRGFPIAATIPWPPSHSSNPQSAICNPQSTPLAVSTGNAIASIARALARLRPDLLLVTGDRVEAFAAATAAHLAGVPVAHVHGGDRALGQVDDALRHAITKLAHVHFPATYQSAARIRMLGEDAWRIHLVGSPGVDGIRRDAAPAHVVRREFGLSPKSFALLVLHPADPDPATEERRARLVLDAALATFDRLVVVYPNNDPGSAGIVKVWRQLHAARIDGVTVRQDLPRDQFLALMRDAAVLLGNSSSGIIEAASFRTPVVDIGPRQQGRERSDNVAHVPYDRARIVRALKAAKTSRWKGKNVYGGEQSGVKMVRVLTKIELNERLRRKLITY